MTQERTELGDLDGDGIVVRVSIQHPMAGQPLFLIEVDAGSMVSGFTLDPFELEAFRDMIDDSRVPFAEAIEAWQQQSKAEVVA